MTNWERKSKYLLEEIVKFEHYVDSLKAGMSLRLKKRGEKALERALTVSENNNNQSGKSRWKGFPEQDTIPEGEEPPLTPNAPNVTEKQRNGQHRRETAETSSSS